MASQVKTKKNVYNTDSLSFEEVEELRKIQKEENFYTSDDVNEIYFVKDILANNWIQVDDLDTILNIIKEIKLWKSIL